MQVFAREEKKKKNHTTELKFFPLPQSLE